MKEALMAVAISAVIVGMCGSAAWWLAGWIVKRDDQKDREATERLEREFAELIEDQLLRAEINRFCDSMACEDWEEGEN